jgi:hypothetical protein
MLKKHFIWLISPLLLSTSLAFAETPPPEVPPPHSSPAYMMIDPKVRAQDYKEAFEVLRKEKTTGKVFFQLLNGSTIANIIDMTLMGNSTLILFRFNSNQGIRFQIVKVEEIAFISYT